MMKSSCLIFAIFVQFSCLDGFIIYPFNGDVWLKKFLDAFAPVPIVTPNLDIDLMKHAIDGENCVRKCAKNDKRVCYFKFTLRHYQVLGG